MKTFYLKKRTATSSGSATIQADSISFEGSWVVFRKNDIVTKAYPCTVIEEVAEKETPAEDISDEDIVAGFQN